MAHRIQGDLNVQRHIDARSISLIADGLVVSGNALSVTGNSVINQNVTTTGTPTFSTVTLTSPITADLQAATKQYVDSVAAGLDPKESVLVATTGDIGGTYNALINGTGGFTGAPTVIDGITLTGGNRVLVKNQADPKQNGIFVTSGDVTTWYRSPDMNGTPAAEVSAGNFTFVESGAINTGHGYTVIGSGILTLNTDNIIWSQYSDAGDFTASNGIAKVVSDFQLDLGTLNTQLTTATTSHTIAIDDGTTKYITINNLLNSLDIVRATGANGFITKTADDTYTERTITGTTNYIDVTNGDGSAGNPTITISPTYSGQTSITTLGTIITGTWNGSVIGNAYGGTGLDTSSASAGQLLIGNGSGFSLSTLTAGSGIVITNANGAITINSTSEVTATLAGSGLVSDGTLNVGAGSGIIVTADTVSVDASNININSFGGTPLLVGRGGTGVTTLTSNGVLYGNGTSAIQATSVSTKNGSILHTVSAGGAPSFTSNISLDDFARTISFTSGNAQIASLGNASSFLRIIADGDGLSSTPELRLWTADSTNSTTGNIELRTGTAVGASQAGNILFKINGSTEVARVRTSGFNLTAGNTYQINNTPVLSDTTLGSTVVNSSLTSVGILTAGTWNASVIGTQYGGTGSGILPTSINDGDLLIGDNAGDRFVKTTLTAGSGITITNGPGSITLAVDFSASVTAGSGLVQTANVIDVVSANGGIVVNADNIALTTDGSTLTITSNGIKVATNGITGNEIAANAVTETHLNTSVAGAGLTGGGGSALAVGAGTGITVGANDVSVDVATLAGSGIASTGNVFSVNPDNSTIKLVGDTVALKKYTVNIDVSDWNDTGEYAFYTISGTVHGYQDFATVTTYAAYSGGVPIIVWGDAQEYIEFQVDRIRYVANTNDIELRVVSDGVTDARFAGRIVVG